MPPRRPPRRRSGARSGVRRRSFLWRFRRLFFLAGLLVVAGLGGVGYVLARVPLPEADPSIETTFLFDADGQELAELSGEIDRESVPLSRVNPSVQQAVLAFEDRDFYEHPGVNAVAIGRATLADLRGRPLQGGSTITQQYVKNVYLTSERTLLRKLKEATLAVKLERTLEKPEILERYLNTIYFGRGAYGVEAAAEAYFGLRSEQLTLPYAAYLAGLIRGPEDADANAGDPESTIEAERRRDLVLRAMEEEGYITADERLFVENIPVEDYTLPRDEEGTAEVQGGDIGTQHFVEYVRQELQDIGFTDAQINGGGLRVFTTLDLDLQRAAYEAVYTQVLSGEGGPAGALVSVDADGHVLAMVGGRAEGSTDAFAEVNLAVGTDGGGTGRQAGSAFKPFVLATAVDRGYSVESALESPAQVEFPGADAGEDYQVSNFDEAAHGRISLVQATKVSSNTVYTQLAERMGPEAVAEMAGRLGIASPLTSTLSLALGTSEVSVLEMADAYLTFATRGTQVDPVVITRVTDSDGRVLPIPAPRRRQVLDEADADVINLVLRQVVEGGTGRSALLDTPAAGKTGTTQDFGDAWFVGYTPGLSTAVWIGYAEGQDRPLRGIHGVDGGVTGGTLPADIWKRYMEFATGRVPFYRGTFVEPESLDGESLDPNLGQVRFVPTTTTVPGERDERDEEPSDEETEDEESTEGEDSSDDESESESESESETEDLAEETTTTTAPSGSTTTASTAPPSTTTTAPPRPTTTAPPAPTTTATPPTTAPPI